MSTTTTTTTTKKQNWNMFATFDTNANTNTTFCPDCGALIELPECNPITCGRCGFSCTYDDLPKTKVVTKSAGSYTFTNPYSAINHLVQSSRV